MQLKGTDQKARSETFEVPLRNDGTAPAGLDPNPVRRLVPILARIMHNGRLYDPAVSGQPAYLALTAKEHADLVLCGGMSADSLWEELEIELVDPLDAADGPREARPGPAGAVE